MIKITENPVMFQIPRRILRAAHALMKGNVCEYRPNLAFLRLDPSRGIEFTNDHFLFRADGEFFEKIESKPIFFTFEQVASLAKLPLKKNARDRTITFRRRSGGPSNKLLLEATTASLVFPLLIEIDCAAFEEFTFPDTSKVDQSGVERLSRKIAVSLQARYLASFSAAAKELGEGDKEACLHIYGSADDVKGSSLSPYLVTFPHEPGVTITAMPVRR